MGNAHNEVVQRMLLSLSMRKVCRPSKLALQEHNSHTKAVVVLSKMWYTGCLRKGQSLCSNWHEHHTTHKNTLASLHSHENGRPKRLSRVSAKTFD